MKHLIINNSNRGLLLFFFFFLSISIIAYTQPVVNNYVSSGSWTCPPGITSVTVECWGSGGAGAAVGGNPAAGGGGAGGAYARKVVSVVPGNVYTVTVGASKVSGSKAAIASTNNGNPSWFGSTSLVYAQGGPGAAGGNNTTSYNGAGAQGSSLLSIGDVVFAGGNGATGASASGSAGGAGGGAAGPTSMGGNASGVTGGTGAGGNPSSGNGANGPSNNTNGASGNIYGGGGSGGKANTTTDRAGGAGGAGYVRLTYQPLTAPSNLTATAQSTSSISLTWIDNSSAESGFQIERSLTSGSGFSLVITTASNATSYTDIGLNENTTYYYRIRAISAGAYSADTPESFAATQIAIPAAPSNLVVTAVSATSIGLTWTDNSSNETGFEIERSLTSGSGFILITTTASNATSYTDNGLTANTTYYYRMRSIKAGANSTYTSESSATTPEPVPSAPSNLVATLASVTSIQLTWVDNSNNETEFVIERSLIFNPDVGGPGGGPPGDPPLYSVYATVPANTTSFLDSNLNSQTTYYYQVRAVNSGGDSYSNEVSAATPTLQAPTNLLITTVTSTSISLSWTDNSIDETGFNIERSVTSGSGFSLITTTASNAISFTDNGLTENTTYYYRIQATKTGANSTYTSEASATTIMPVPADPTGLTAIAISDTTITLSWTDLSTNETGFQIERSTTVGSGFVLIATTVADTVNYSDLGLTPATTYYYRIRALNEGGYSSYSAEVSATTAESIPMTPGAFSANSSSPTTINLTWIDASDNETGFQIERSFTAGSSFLLVATVAANAVSYSDISLTSDTKYYYRLRAINGNAKSGYVLSNATTTPSIPTAPAALTATPTSSTSIILTWSDASNNETGFQIERSSTSGGGFNLIATTAVNAVAYLDNNLISGVTYYYRIRSINLGGTSAFTSEVNTLLALAGTSQLCENIFCNSNGGVGIGTQVVPIGYALSIKGKMMAEGVKVALQANWPDYVFEKDYKLTDIPSLKKYIDTHGHLPNMPTAEAVKKEGIDMEEINILLLEKIEEMSLYLIQMEERIKSLEVENRDLKKNK